MSPKLKPISRRQFLKMGCITTAVVGLTACGVGAIGDMLGAHGFSVDVKPIKENPHLDR